MVVVKKDHHRWFKDVELCHRYIVEYSEEAAEEKAESTSVPQL